MNAQLGTVSTGAGRGRTAAYYQRRGYLTGAGTLVDELLRHVGLRNLAASLGKPALSRIGLEELTRAQPDYLVVETETDRISDQGTEMLHHPVLASIPRIRLPQSWTVCGGPAYVRAARSIAAQLR
jgi:iron complex transport system substrate-binding protein